MAQNNNNNDKVTCTLKNQNGEEVTITGNANDKRMQDLCHAKDTGRQVTWGGNPYYVTYYSMPYQWYYYYPYQYAYYPYTYYPYYGWGGWGRRWW